MTRILTVCALTCLIAACGTSPQTDSARPPQADAARDRAVLDSIRQDFARGEEAGDADAVYAHAAPDIVVMPPNRPVKIGSTNRDWIRAFLSAYTVKVQYTSEEIVIGGDWAFDRGFAVETATPKAGGAATTGTAKYLWVYQRLNGEWKQARLIWNDNGPPEQR